MTTDSKPNGLWFFNSHLTIRVSHEDSGDGISIIEHRLPFGEAPPLHVHHDEDEIFHVLNGERKFQVGGETRFVRRGETLLAPRGVPHAFRVVLARRCACPHRDARRVRTDGARRVASC